MITSFVQYLLLLPSYVNILLIYAFCNLHDVSWGTKGDNGSAKDLGQVKKVEKDGKEMVRAGLIRLVLGSRVALCTCTALMSHDSGRGGDPDEAGGRRGVVAAGKAGIEGACKGEAHGP
jgi:hypothetical protein